MMNINDVLVYLRKLNGEAMLAEERCFDEGDRESYSYWNGCSHGLTAAIRTLENLQQEGK